MSVMLASDTAPRGDSRGASRHACEVRTTCQPPSAWAKDPWPAVIRNIGPAGLSLTLGRRFERGSGLAIEIPGEDDRVWHFSRDLLLFGARSLTPYGKGDV